jgi:hypothetical protein
MGGVLGVIAMKFRAQGTGFLVNGKSGFVAIINQILWSYSEPVPVWHWIPGKGPL